MGTAIAGNRAVVLFSALLERANGDCDSAPAQRSLHHALSEALCGDLQLSAADGGHWAAGGDFADGDLLSRATVDGGQHGCADAAAVAASGVNGAVYRGAGLSLQLFRNGLYAGRGGGAGGRGVSVPEQFSGMGGVLPHRERHGGEPDLRQPAGGGGAPVAPESGAAGGDQLIGRGGGQDDFAAEHCDWRYDGGSGRARGKDSAPDLLAQRAAGRDHRRDRAGAGVLGSAAGSLKPAVDVEREGERWRKNRLRALNPEPDAQGDCVTGESLHPWS